MGTISLIRVYDARRGDASYEEVKKACTGEAEPSVFLVDRLWPRGIAKADLPLDAWVKEAGPSTELRQWFGHDPEKFEEFSTRYETELDSREEIDQILQASKRRDIVLLFSARDTAHNQAVVLRKWINAKR